MTRRLFLRFFFTILAITVFVGVCTSDHLLFIYPERGVQSCIRRLGERLELRHGLKFYMSFDEPHPVEWISHEFATAPGRFAATGRIGKGTRFDGESSTFIRTSAQWPSLDNSSYTMSMWVKIDPRYDSQEICYVSKFDRGEGFKLLGGRMEFCVPATGGERVLEYPFTSYDEFVHVAATVDVKSKVARLYENGKLMDETLIDTGPMPQRLIEIGHAQWEPFVGVIDEVSVWNRALAVDEIHALANAARPLHQRLEPLYYTLLRLSTAVASGIKTALRVCDRFNPYLYEGRIASLGIKEVNFHFSKGDARHFTRVHESSLVSGRRTNRAAKPRTVQIQYNGTTTDADLSLGESYFPDRIVRRPSYVVQTESPLILPGSEVVRLYPPELYGFFHPDRKFPVPLDAGAYVRILIDGQPKGVYYAESFERMGSAWIVDDFRKTVNLKFPLRRAYAGKSDSGLFLSANELLRRQSAVVKMLASDINHPWSLSEWRWRIKQQKRDFEKGAFHEDLITEYDVLGSNTAPYQVTADLDFGAVEKLAPGISWASSRPEYINELGRVSLPAGDLPVHVRITASLPREAGDQKTFEFEFRVMPRNPRLPALMLYVNAPVVNTARSDFSARYYPAGTNSVPRLMRGTSSTGGGIKHRGNTSYLHAEKKPLSLRFDAPHHIINTTNTKHLYLLSGYSDDTRMRDKLCYDLFRSFGDASRPRVAAEVEWIEVFINGEYFGVFEMCSRVHESMFGVDEKEDAPEKVPHVFKIRARTKLFAEVTADAFEQILPDIRIRNCASDLEELMRFTANSSGEAFARDIAKHMDVDNVIDHFLLVNFSGNADGRVNNFYLVKLPPPDGRFLFIPWDYDKTFDQRRVPLSNYLVDRMFADVPDFRGRVRNRWAELRSGVLSVESMDRQISDMHKRLQGYMDFEYKLLSKPDGVQYDAVVEQFRQTVHDRLDYMDTMIDATAPK